MSPPSIVNDDKGQKKMQEIIMAYRLTGITIFNANEIEDDMWSKYRMDDFPAAPKEIGIRFETFANASYHEPYYVMIRNKEISRRVDKQEGRNNQKSRITLQVFNHTVPHWVPLREIERKYLNRDITMFIRIISEHLQEIVGERESSVP
ncbi:Cenp-O kinetochore centromere component-domain-containing protein [Gamsiella multidivaricata]|uniref:Cenp-O kinetochore centromere component-domain-containing protein n=1 Tax=Gamsiella multidivaricata TaxID=101098 RepID=UPI00221FBDFA|nr:Cenp-O kinetochore centromere component-domain-containing protein [Gamsiella multidivaricata]KAI7823055.1 Cenp-O kinetochore centromere component-domain-containing protein [Gamsiella multidivaricata]